MPFQGNESVRHLGYKIDHADEADPSTVVLVDDCQAASSSAPGQRARSPPCQPADEHERPGSEPKAKTPPLTHPRRCTPGARRSGDIFPPADLPPLAPGAFPNFCKRVVIRVIRIDI